MLIEFFFALKDARLPVSIREFLVLLEALRKDIIAPSLDEFYFLARTTLVKDEAYYDKFDQAFGKHFRVQTARTVGDYSINSLPPSRKYLKFRL